MSLSKSEIGSDIKAVARMLNHSPSSVEYGHFGRYHVRTVQKKFKRRWPEIVESIGLRYQQRTSARIAATEELRRDILRVAQLLGRPPARFEYAEHGNFDAETIRRRSGQKTWENALAAISGLPVEQIKSSQARGGCYRTTEEWLCRLQDLSVRLRHAPTTEE